RFLVHPEQSGRAPDSAAIEVLYVNQEIFERSRGLIIEPGGGRQLFASELKQAYPRLRLMIVQPPIRPLPTRSPPDRLDAARGRRLAAELYAAGVPAVLILPTLNERLAVDAVRKVIEVVARCPKRAMVPLSEAVSAIIKDLQQEFSKLDTNDESYRYSAEIP